MDPHILNALKTSSKTNGNSHITHNKPKTLALNASMPTTSHHMHYITSMFA